MPKPASCQGVDFDVIYTKDRKNDILSRCMKNKFFLYGMLILGLLTAISLLLSIKLPLTKSFRIVFGLTYVLFLPGFAWSFVFFESKKMTNIERVTASVAISMLLTPSIVILFNKFGLKISEFNIFIEILIIIFIGGIINTIQNNIIKKLITLTRHVDTRI